MKKGMKKRMISIITATVMCLVAITGCTTQETGGSTAAPAVTENKGTEAPAADAKEAVTTAAGANGAAVSADKKLKVGFTMNNVSGDNYQTAFYDATIAEAEKNNMELIVLDAAGDANLQLNQVDDLMEMKVDVLLVFPCNGVSIIPAVKKASDSGIPVLIVNNDIDEAGRQYTVGFVGPDCVQQGRDAATVFVDYYKDKDMDSIDVIQVEHVPGNMTAVQRGQGFKEGIEGTKVRIIESQTANNSREEAMQITENYLIKYPNPGDIDGIFVQGDNMAFGVMAAVEAAGRVGEFPIVGIAITAESYQKMQAGSYYGSSLQSPYNLAETVVETVAKVAAGENIEYYNAMDNPIITYDTISNFECPNW